MGGHSATSIWWVEARDVTKLPITQETVLQDTELLKVLKCGGWENSDARISFLGGAGEF